MVDLVAFSSLEHLPLVERLAKLLCYQKLERDYKDQFRIVSDIDNSVYINTTILDRFWRDYQQQAITLLSWIKTADSSMVRAGEMVRECDQVSTGGIWHAMIEQALIDHQHVTVTAGAVE